MLKRDEAALELYLGGISISVLPSSVTRRSCLCFEKTEFGFLENISNIVPSGWYELTLLERLVAQNICM